MQNKHSPKVYPKGRPYISIQYDGPHRLRRDQCTDRRQSRGHQTSRHRVDFVVELGIRPATAGRDLDEGVDVPDAYELAFSVNGEEVYCREAPLGWRFAVGGYSDFTSWRIVDAAVERPKVPWETVVKVPWGTLVMLA